MNTTDSNKFLRWSIPGWIAILSAIVFTTLDVISSFRPNQTPQMFPSILALLKVVNNQNTFANIFFVALAGLPLGFIIFQFYFFIRWNSPFSGDGLFPPFIVGRKEDIARTIRNIPYEKLALGDKQWRIDWINHQAFNSDHCFRWQYIESLFTEIAQKIDTKYVGFAIYSRYRYLLDMLHILGASLGAVYLGFFTYLIAKMRFEKLILTNYAAVIAFSLVILIFLLEREDKVQYENSTNGKPNHVHEAVFAFLRNKVQINNPSTLFIFTIGLIIFFASPVLISNDNFDFNHQYGLRILIFLFGSFIWITRSPKKEERWGLGLCLFLSFLISITIRYHRVIYFDKWIDWTFLSPLFIFLVLNMILIKNRQNSRNELSSVQYYTFNRYLEEEQYSRIN